MTPSTQRLLLDTSVVIEFFRAKELGRRIDAEYALRTRAERPLISVVTVGEALGFAMHRKWNQAKTAELASLLAEFTVVDIHEDVVLRLYAEMHAFLTQRGKTLSNNDVWIAASAAATSALLLTTDKDFDSLHGSHITRVCFGQVAGAP